MSKNGWAEERLYVAIKTHGTLKRGRLKAKNKTLASFPKPLSFAIFKKWRVLE
jgi:hypothetical protein